MDLWSTFLLFKEWIFPILVSIIGAFIVYLIQRKRKRLDYEIVSQVDFAKNKKSGKVEIKVLYDGKEVENVRILRVLIKNAGNQTIDIQDFVEPLHFVLPGRGLLLECSVDKYNPDNLAPELLIEEDNKLMIKPILLNQGDEFFLRMITSGDYKVEEIKVFARIKGIKQVRKNNRNRISKYLETFFLVHIILTIAVVFISFFIWSVSLFYSFLQSLAIFAVIWDFYSLKKVRKNMS